MPGSWGTHRPPLWLCRAPGPLSLLKGYRSHSCLALGVSPSAPTAHHGPCLGTDHHKWVGSRQLARPDWTCGPAPPLRMYSHHRNQRRWRPLPSRLCPGLFRLAVLPGCGRVDRCTPKPDPAPDLRGSPSIHRFQQGKPQSIASTPLESRG